MLYRDTCKVSLRRGLAVLAIQARKLAFLAKLETEQKLESKVLPTVGCLSVQEALQGAGSSGILIQGAYLLHGEESFLRS